MITIRKLLCPTEIERPARSALRYSFFIADGFHAALDVIHAAGSEPRRDVPTINEQPPAQLRRESTLCQQLEAIVRAVPTATPGRANTHVMDGGLAVATLAFCASHGSDLILLESELEPDWSLTMSDVRGPIDDIAHRASCPVLTIPKKAASPAPRIARVLFPVGSASSADGALQLAAAFAQKFGATVELLRIRDPGLNADVLPESCFWEIQDGLRLAGVPVEHSAREGSDATDCILSRIDAGGCDLVVMGAQSRGSAAEDRAGTIAKVRRKSWIPVLSLRVNTPQRFLLDIGFRESEPAQFRTTHDFAGRGASESCGGSTAPPVTRC
jgi:nucleotide-binding universal stress UspA family protein